MLPFENEGERKESLGSQLHTYNSTSFTDFLLPVICSDELCVCHSLALELPMLSSPRGVVRMPGSPAFEKPR